MMLAFFVILHWYNTGVWQTDGRTDTLLSQRPARVGENVVIELHWSATARWSWFTGGRVASSHEWPHRGKKQLSLCITQVHLSCFYHAMSRSIRLKAAVYTFCTVDQKLHTVNSVECLYDISGGITVYVILETGTLGGSFEVLPPSVDTATTDCYWLTAEPSLSARGGRTGALVMNKSGALYTVFRKKHTLTFSFISPWVMCRFKQKLQWIYLRNGGFWQCRNQIFIADDDVIMTTHL